jgi:hypothetical protein|tara:strand:- start:20717 stop:20989 length:273 start_codon:yes stop_codon:yes gene_type:complete
MKVPTVKFIIKRWLRNRLDNGLDSVASHEIETTLVEYGKEYWGKLHTPSTYSRAWRTLKSGTELDDIDVNKVEEIKNKSAETTWKLVTGI